MTSTTSSLNNVIPSSMENSILDIPVQYTIETQAFYDTSVHVYVCE